MFVHVANSHSSLASPTKEFPLLETVLFVLLSYCTFLIGEGFGLSGIVAVLFCGVAQARVSVNACVSVYIYMCVSVSFCV